MLEEMLTRECINLNLKAKTKEEVIDEIINMLDKAGRLNDKEEYKKEILKRESQSSTGLEEGIAIPHAKTKAVKVPSIAFGRSLKGVDYESLDGEPSKLFFMIAAPANATDSHIEVLSKLTTLLLDDDLRESLLNAKTEDEVLDLLLSQVKEEKKENHSNSQDGNIEVLAVTACPTGIAHTYMAADSLIKKAKELGVTIKVETNGSTGVKNRLTDEEIKNAKGIIVAADKNVEMARFDGKNVEIVPVKEGIKNPEKLIKNAINKTAPIYKSNEQSSGVATKKEKQDFINTLCLGFLICYHSL